MSKPKNSWDANRAITRNLEWMRAEQERRRSSVATPHRNRKKYTRKTKHKGNDDD